MIRLKCSSCNLRVRRNGLGAWVHQGPVATDHLVILDTAEVRRTLCKDTLLVQDACNLGAVALGLHELVNDLRELDSAGTDALNQHPLVRLWVNELVSLAVPGAEINMYDGFSADYGWASSGVST